MYPSADRAKQLEELAEQEQKRYTEIDRGVHAVKHWVGPKDPSYNTFFSRDEDWVRTFNDRDADVKNATREALLALHEGINDLRRRVADLETAQRRERARVSSSSPRPPLSQLRDETLQEYEPPPEGSSASLLRKRQRGAAR